MDLFEQDRFKREFGYYSKYLDKLLEVFELAVLAHEVNNTKYDILISWLEDVVESIKNVRDNNGDK